MTNCKRHYFKWNINELIALQREYGLLGLSIQEIANKHKRSVKSILCKLEQENFIQNWNEAKGFDEYTKSVSELDYYLRDIDDDDDDGGDDDDDDLMEEDCLDLSSIETEEKYEKNYMSQLNKIGIAMSVKKIFQDFSYVVNKFTNITSNNSSNNSSNNNLCEM
jgi:hypothetical protein